jgi:flagellin
MISLQTNVTSLEAQQDLNVNNAFQSNTIQQLSSGYRINSSADDAAGLAVANQYNSDTVELQQGVRNANDGLSQLQIVDGGLSNISNMLNRMKTLATQSATSTFTGNRTTLNNEYQDLVSEISRQADDIELNNGGNLNTNLNVYIGGGRTSDVKGTSLVNINLSGSANAVDATSLNLQGTTVIGGGTSFNGTNTVTDLNNVNALFLTSSGTETFTINYANAAGNVTSQNVVVTGTANGLTGAALVQQLNSTLANDNLTGITAQIGPNGDLQFSGGSLLSVAANTGSTSGIVTTGATLLNGANYQSTGAFVPFVAGGGGPTSETMNVTVGTSNYGITLTSATTGTTAADTAADAVASLNAQLKGSGVYATNVGNTVTLQSARAFSVAETNNTPGSGGVGGAAGSGFLESTNFVQDMNGASGGGPAYSDTVAFQPFEPGGNGGTPTSETVTLEKISDYNLTLTSATAGTTAADTIGDAINSLNAQLTSYGINNIMSVTQSGGSIVFNSTNGSFYLFGPGSGAPDAYTQGVGGGGASGTGSLFGTTPQAETVTPPTTSASATGNAQNAITAINSAVTALGLVQGAVGAGENTLNYAISLAQSQITNFTAAQSQIKDADVAAEAANLTKAQVLQQASIAAMAQANSAPEAVLKLLQ